MMNILDMINRSSSMLEVWEPVRFIHMCYAAHLSFHKNQWGLLLRIKQVQVSFCLCSLINVFMRRKA